MDSKQELLKTWESSAGVMHISHHLAAARYAGRHRWYGGLTAGMSALVSASAFVALQQREEMLWLIITGLLSVSAAVCTGINTFLRHDGLATQHHQAATLFQGLRREIEEELAFYEDRGTRSGFEHLRNRWSDALKSSPPLPQDIHDKVKNDRSGQYSERSQGL